MGLMLPGRNGTTLEAAYSGRDNAFNLMRLCFALMVVAAHAGVIGWGAGHDPIPIPVDLGGIAVTGFFGLSGFLISRSGRRSGPVRFVWHRVLRIFPGYWVCLIATAFVLAPLLFRHEHGTLHLFRHSGPGPFGYVYHNVLTDQRQADVAQQALSILGLPRYGVRVYLGTTFVAVLVVAMLSWHAVEKPAMRLKNWSPPFGRRGERAADPDVPPAHPAAIPVPAPRSAPVPPLVPTPRTAEADLPEQEKPSLVPLPRLSEGLKASTPPW